MLRTIAERLSRGRSFRFRLPEVYGGCQMHVTPEAGLRYWFPSRGIKADEALLKNTEESRMLHDLGYTLYDSDLPPGERRPLTQPAYNIIAVPA